MDVDKLTYIRRDCVEHKTLTPHYGLVPKELEANIEWRKRICALAKDNVSVQGRLRRMCAEDPLFYLNAFIWTFDPRDVDFDSERVLPFITYDYQDHVILALIDAIGRKDVRVMKSRCMGFTWITLFVFNWMAQFKKRVAFLVVSRNDDLVDKTDDPDTLFAKLDFMLEFLPSWLRHPYDKNDKTCRKDNHLGFPDTKSSIDGAATTYNVGRAGRRTAVMVDEADSLDAGGHAVNGALCSVSKTRIIGSTPKGNVGSWFDNAKNNDDSVRIVLHWTTHPIYRVDIYLDKEGKPRSPWYDAECKRLGNPVLIAQELDCDMVGSAFGFFPSETIKKAKLWAKPPAFRGEFEYEDCAMRPKSFVSDDHGSFLLWDPLVNGKPKPAKYVIGVDVACGSTYRFETGSSNSVAAVGNAETGEKVAEFAIGTMTPEEFGRLVFALGRFYCDENKCPALVIWETNGPGGAFGVVLIRGFYPNLFMRKNELGNVTQVRPFSSAVPGWHTSDKRVKTVLLGGYRDALGKDFKERSMPTLNECLNYVMTTTRDVIHRASKTTIDPNEAAENHGDRVIASALLWRGIQEIRSGNSLTTKDDSVSIPRNCLANRRRAADRERELAEAY